MCLNSSGDVAIHLMRVGFKAVQEQPDDQEHYTLQQNKTKKKTVQSSINLKGSLIYKGRTLQQKVFQLFLFFCRNLEV